MTRGRDLGITIGDGRPGRWNAITDVPGVRVGHTTIIRGDGPLVVGQGPVRTGVTMIVPHDGDVFTQPLYAGSHTLNGNGELTGLEWIREAGHLTGPIGITNTHSVGVVRDAIIRHATRKVPFGTSYWALPVAGETYDGQLHDIAGGHVRAEHVAAALAAASSGPVAEVQLRLSMERLESLGEVTGILVGHRLEIGQISTQRLGKASFRADLAIRGRTPSVVSGAIAAIDDLEGVDIVSTSQAD